MTELSLTRLSKAMRLSSRPTSDEMLTENLTALAAPPTRAGTCAFGAAFCRVAITLIFYPLVKKGCKLTLVSLR